MITSPGIGDELERIHREVEHAMGHMCVQMVRGRGSLTMIDAWATALERGARDLRALEARLTEARAKT